jgi:ribosomal protein S18 acetylase RimI-like enzyme
MATHASMFTYSLRVFEAQTGAARISEITALLHAAYAPLAARGMKYVASHQDDATTLQRLIRGRALLAENAAHEIIGTVTLYPPAPESTCALYRESDVYVIGQFAVHPNLQRTGLGTRMIDWCINETRTQGGQRLALDTSEHADHLIAWYKKLGFAFAQYTRWDAVNYQSIVLVKSVSAL